jgi:hypothetical protein
MKFEKLYKLLNEELIDEGLKDIAAAGIIGLSALSPSAKAKDPEKIEQKQAQSKINMIKLLDAIHQVESSGRTKNVPDGDDGAAVGPLQIWKIMVDEVNDLSDKYNFSYEDRKNIVKAKQICSAYLSYMRKRHNSKFGTELTPERLAEYWNAGGRWPKRFPDNPEYVKKIKKAYKNSRK